MKYRNRGQNEGIQQQGGAIGVLVCVGGMFDAFLSFTQRHTQAY